MSKKIRMAFFIFVLLYMASLYDVSDILRFLKTIPHSFIRLWGTENRTYLNLVVVAVICYSLIALL